MNGLEIVQRVYERLRKPDELALSLKTVLRAVSEKLAQKRLDLVLSDNNHLMRVSGWFVPPAGDFELSAENSELSDIMLPVRVESLPCDSELEIGEDVPIVGYGALVDSPGAVSLYGDPLRISFRDGTEYLSGRKIRIAYESDFYFDTDTDSQLAASSQLPAFFTGMVALEAAYDLLDTVDDKSPEWTAFADRAANRWTLMIADERRRWEKYVKKVKGNQVTGKRTFFQNEIRPGRRLGQKIFRG